ncbi:MAG: histidine kinase [Deltaproteobacteria bacterium]|nr:MAG: histidine kinase [Deltaproteobacteria bacterium]
MKYTDILPTHFGLGLRIALLSWLVAIGTLILFTLLIIPQQKAIFFHNLESKANSVAVSLYDTIAEAAINEDFASLVSACRTLIEGDPDLEFLVVVKNNGFAVINQRQEWKIDQNMEAFWLPNLRKQSSVITTTPILDKQVFHHAQPFNYSGIEWGWFHVGLSLQDYDRSITLFYRQTFWVGLLCVGFSLLISLGYARKLIKPLVRLRQIVRQIANGNLKVRADFIRRRDEIGNLAISVNAMAEGLLHRDTILNNVSYAAQHFLHNCDWETVIQDILEKMGRAVGACRVYIFENHTNHAGQLCMSQRYEWVAENVTPQLSNPVLQNLPYGDSGLSEQIISLLRQNNPFSMTLSEMNGATRAIVEPQGIASVLFIPIHVESTWWGYIGFDDCTHERRWLESEQDSVRAVADMLGVTISRQQAQESLLKAKAILEERVEERTLELKRQVTAKERTLRQLAETQSSLMEMSRTAGMAEVATGVLHNVGNVLNSVNVSSNLIREQIQQSRIANIGKVADLLNHPEGGLAHFLTSDPRGRQIPAYLTSLSTALNKEHQDITNEVDSLHHKIDHIKEIVAMQQTYGRVLGVVETVVPKNLMEDALTLNTGALTRHQIKVVRDYEDTPSISVDKHTVMQILLNFIQNAKHACSEHHGSEKRVTLRIFTPTSGRIAFQVQDTGVGILPKNLQRIFQHGFTTRKKGHGFGLHSGILAARNLGGTITANSDGLGCGATFTLEVPIHPGENE